jgi:hypothetical protein
MPPVAVSLRWHYPRPAWHRFQPPFLSPHRHLPLFLCPPRHRHTMSGLCDVKKRATARFGWSYYPNLAPADVFRCCMQGCQVNF